MSIEDRNTDADAAAAVLDDASAAGSFTADDSPTNEFGERRFVHKLRWFGPVNMLMILGATIPTGAAASLMAYNFTVHLGEVDANAAIGIANVFGALAGAIGAIVGGNVSDHTRTRLGRRNPWIMFGAILGAACILSLSLASFSLIWPAVILFCGFQIGLNIMLSSYYALLPDRVSSRLMGRASAWASMGTLLGNALGGIVTSILVSTFGEANLATAFLLVPWTMVIMMAVIVLALPGAKLSRQEGTERFDVREMLAGFRPPKDKQFWYVYLGRLVFMVGLMLLVQTQTQQLIYHFDLPLKTAASTAALLGIVLAIGSLISTVIAGPLSDKLRRRKAPAMVSAVIFALSTVVLLLSTDTWVLFVNVGLAAFAFGAFSSVDQAIMVEILPNKETAARDLGFLNTTNTLSGVIGGGLGALLIGTIGYVGLFITAGVLALLCIAFFIPINRVR